MLIIACVLKSGGVYDWNYVHKLFRGVRRNLTIPFRFICLTDMFPSVPFLSFQEQKLEFIQLQEDWPHWWSKIELFNQLEFQNSRICYFDLDTIIVGNIDYIVSYKGKFAVLRNFFKEERIGSGLMFFSGFFGGEIYRKFKLNSDYYIKRFIGDQNFIESFDFKPDLLQEIFPKTIFSFKSIPKKTNIMNYRKEIRKSEKIICFHGDPKPRDVVDKIPWVKEHWS